MDYLYVDPNLRMDPDYIRAWWERFEQEERILGEIGLPLPAVPKNAPGYPVEEEVATDTRAGQVEGMDPDQSRVVLHPGGPALVMAGAGSGKTRTIVARVVHLLRRGVDPDSILCLTFTRKAAREMKHRIEKEAGEIAKRITVSTFHALALDLLRTHAAYCGRTTNFSIWDDDIQRHEIKALVKGHPNAEPREPGDGKLIEWVDPADVSNALDTLREEGEEMRSKRFYAQLGALHEQAWEVAMAYQELKETCNALDFADLVWIATLRLLAPESPKRVAIQQRWEHVIVDEYQDTNRIQEMFLARLTEAHQNLMVVGDEDQAIYAFRGSDVRFIRSFPQRYPKAVTYLLGRNYRSTPEVVEAANALISQNRERNFKRVWSESDHGHAIAVGRWESPNQEARAVANEIRIARENGWPDAELAVLVRTRRQFIPLQVELQKLKIPFHVVGDLPWYARADAKVILAWMRAVLNPHDLDAGAAVLKSWDGLGNGTVALWKETMESLSDPMFSRLGYLQGKPGLRPGTKRGQRFSAFMEAWARWESEAIHTTQSLKERVDELLRPLGFVTQILEGKLSQKPSDVEEATRRESFLQTLLSILPEEPGTGRLDGMQKWVDDLFTNSVQDKEQSGVCLSTIHGSKGLEWSCVWLPGWSSGVFPSERAAGPAAIEEERRLAYVAVTRARHYLSVSWYAASMIPTPKDHTPSTFLAELDPKLARDETWTHPSPEPEAAPVQTVKLPVHYHAPWTQPQWFVDHFGEAEHTIPDNDQPENLWFGWDEAATLHLAAVEVHPEDDPIRCIACNRAIRMSVSLVVSGTVLPRVRMGRRCAARYLGAHGKIFDATRAAKALSVPILHPPEPTPTGTLVPLFTPGA